jgi:ketosteroid isomerase-like protein
MAQDESDEVRELLAREAIRAVIHRYCRAIDRCDAQLLTSCYHEDAVEDHGGFFLGTRDEWVSMVIANLHADYTATTHMATNIAIELEGEEAHAETYVLAAHESRDTGSGVELQWLGGRYIDRFVRRDGQWRILRRTLVVDWTHGEPLVVAFGEGAPENSPTAGLVLRRGLRSHDDPAYADSARALSG